MVFLNGILGTVSATSKNFSLGTILVRNVCRELSNRNEREFVFTSMLLEHMKTFRGRTVNEKVIAKRIFDSKIMHIFVRGWKDNIVRGHSKTTIDISIRGRMWNFFRSLQNMIERISDTGFWMVLYLKERTLAEYDKSPHLMGHSLFLNDHLVVNDHHLGEPLRAKIRMEVDARTRTAMSADVRARYPPGTNRPKNIRRVRSNPVTKKEKWATGHYDKLGDNIKKLIVRLKAMEESGVS